MLRRRDRGKLDNTGILITLWIAAIGLLSVASTVGIVWLIVHFARKYW